MKDDIRLKKIKRSFKNCCKILSLSSIVKFSNILILLNNITGPYGTILYAKDKILALNKHAV